MSPGLRIQWLGRIDVQCINHRNKLSFRFRQAFSCFKEHFIYSFWHLAASVVVIIILCPAVVVEYLMANVNSNSLLIIPG